MGNSSKKTKALRGRKVKAVASAPPKVEVVGNVEETTPLFQTPVVAVPVGADFGESLRQQHVTTRVTTSTTRGLGWEEDDCVGWVLSMLLNFTWIVFGGGIPVAALYLIGGILFCVSVVGFPCGLQLLKLARLALFPFGNAIASHERNNGSAAGSINVDCFCHNLGNILFLPLSIVLLVVHLIAALVCACTIVGIPFSYAHLKLASLAVCPFGRDQEGPQGGYENVTTTTTITTESDANILSLPGGGYQSVV